MKRWLYIVSGLAGLPLSIGLCVLLRQMNDENEIKSGSPNLLISLLMCIVILLSFLSFVSLMFGVFVYKELEESTRKPAMTQAEELQRAKQAIIEATERYDKLSPKEKEEARREANVLHLRYIQTSDETQARAAHARRTQLYRDGEQET